MARMNYDINIEGADNGFTVRIGCKKLVFKNEESGAFVTDLEQLLVGGAKAEQKLRKQYFGEDMNILAGQTGCVEPVPPRVEPYCR